MTPTEIRLRARLRRNDDDDDESNRRSSSSNLFVRLAPSTAVRLRDRAAALPESSSVALLVAPEEPANSSILVSSPHGRRTSTKNIDFLPLAITNPRSNVTVYASYNGGDAEGEIVLTRGNFTAVAIAVSTKKRKSYTRPMIESVKLVTTAEYTV